MTTYPEQVNQIYGYTQQLFIPQCNPSITLFLLPTQANLVWVFFLCPSILEQLLVIPGSKGFSNPKIHKRGIRKNQQNLNLAWHGCYLGRKKIKINTRKCNRVMETVRKNWIEILKVKNTVNAWRMNAFDRVINIFDRVKERSMKLRTSQKKLPKLKKKEKKNRIKKKTTITIM